MGDLQESRGLADDADRELRSFFGEEELLAQQLAFVQEAQDQPVHPGLGPQVRVNGIAPGLVETPWLQNGMGAERYAAGVQAYKGRVALADIIQPEDVARAAWYLGVDAVKTTGEVLPVDAGAKLLPV